MDMSDINRSSATPPQQSQSDAVDAGRWRDLVNGVGREIAGPLTAALERIHTLTTTGRIDRASLRALREEVESARAAGMIAQQLARFSAGRMRISHERVSLQDTVNTVLQHRSRETEARGIKLKPSLKPVDVIVDATLLFSLLNTLLDWAFAHAHSPVELTVDLKAWPAHARLMCRFGYQPADQFAADPTQPLPADRLDTLQWNLVEQIVQTMGLTLARSSEDGKVAVTMEFPRTVNDELEGVSTIELDQGFALSTNSKPLAGSQVLVVGSRREMRTRVRDAIRHMGMIVDLVNSVDEAVDFCREGLPHAIIVEGILRSEKLNMLRREIAAEVPDFPFIEIVEEGTAFEMSGFGGTSMGRVGRDAIESALPSVLMFELSKTV